MIPLQLDPNSGWGVLLDGFAGAIVGGLVTWLAVMLTIKHERRQAREAVLRVALSEMQATGFRLGMYTTASASPPEVADGASDLLQVLARVTATARRAAPPLYEDLVGAVPLLQAVARLTRNGDGTLAIDLLQHVSTAAGMRAYGWLLDPKTFNKDVPAWPTLDAYGLELAPSKKELRAFNASPPPGEEPQSGS